jgi:arabinofuranosyltransferase
MQLTTQQRRAAWVAIWMAASAVAIWRAWPSAETLVDDAFITARYAQHFADGYGLVYNAGEPAIEGYTNLAWTVTLGALLKLGLPAHQTMVWLGMCFGTLVVGASMGLTRALIGRETWWPALAGLLVALNPHLAVVTTNGLETSMYCAALLAGLWFVFDAKGNWRIAAGVFLGTIGWIRPEGAVVAVLCCLYDLASHWREWKTPQAWAIAVPAGVVESLLFVFRKLYYGEWVPNTVHAKDTGFYKEWAWNWNRYLKPDRPVWIGLVVVLVLLLVVPKGWRKRLLVFVCAAALMAIGFQVNMWMPGGRLLVPSLLMAICGYVAASANVPKWGSYVFAVPLVVNLLYLPLSDVQTYARAYDGRHTVLEDNGAKIAAEHLREHGPEGGWMATRDAGVLAYYVGTKTRVAELHNRALTQKHIDGKDVDITEFTPETPEYIGLTTARHDGQGFRYGNDKKAFTRANRKAPYVYLGRVRQHYHRFYDIYARADLNIPPLPKEVVVNKQGPTPRAK